MSNYCPFPWKEDPTPQSLITCMDCGLYKHGSRMIWGEGNPDAPIFVLLDNPGAREDKDGKEYVCGTRQTLQQAANRVGLNEDDLYITYVLKRRPKKAYEKEETRHICMQHFQEQLIKKSPILILCMGNVAVQTHFENPNIDVKSLRGEIHHVKGYATAVAYHPLAIRRRPNLQTTFENDWQLVAEYYKSKL